MGDALFHLGLLNRIFQESITVIHSDCLLMDDDHSHDRLACTSPKLSVSNPEWAPSRKQQLAANYTSPKRLRLNVVCCFVTKIALSFPYKPIGRKS